MYRQTPACLQALTRDLKAQGLCHNLCPAQGQSLRQWAALKPWGLFMVMGHHIAQEAVWLQDGLHANAKMVVLEGYEAAASTLKRHLGYDLRLAFHAQDPREFLQDMKQHSVDLFFLDADVMHNDVLSAIVPMVSEGGVILIQSPDDQNGLNQVRSILSSFNDRHYFVALSDQGLISIVAGRLIRRRRHLMQKARERQAKTHG